MGLEPARDVDHAVLAARLPHPRLVDHVVVYVGYDRGSTRLTRRLIALGSIVMVIDLDDPTRRMVPGSPAPAVSSPVSGLSDRPMTYEQAGPERGVIVELTPLGARALFDRPLRELANASVGLADLLGPRARRLAEQLAESRDWAERFRLLDDQLTRWMRDGPALAPPVREAWLQLVRSAGRTKISALAEQVGWTRQYLNARFHDQVGLPPKTVARTTRLHRALRLVTRSNPPSWSEVAAACGYADQPHLNLDFRALTGCTPTELVTFDNAQGEVFLGLDSVRDSLWRASQRPVGGDRSTLGLGDWTFANTTPMSDTDIALPVAYRRQCLSARCGHGASTGTAMITESRSS